MDFCHAVWAQQVAAAADLPEERLENRLTAIISETIDHPSASIPQAAGSDSEAKATYRFYGNAHVCADSLRLGFCTDTARRCLEEDVLLVVQDTTSLNLTGLHCVPELGPIDSGGLARGVLLHTTLGVTTTGRVVGPLHQQYWARPLPGQPPPEEKESGKWINGVDGARDVLYTTAGFRPVPRLIHVMDREGDAYEVMMAIVDAGDSAVIRCAQDRRIDDPLGRAHAAVRNQPVLCRQEIVVPRKTGAPERRAHVEVRSMQVTLVPDLEEVPTRLAHGMELGRGVGARASARRRAGALAALDVRACGDCGRGAGGRAEIHVPVANRGSTLGAQERLQGREFAA